MTTTAALLGESPRKRQAFLDAARAVAALAVLGQHLFEQVSHAFSRFSMELFNVGVFGVILFFLVSGYVIPLSLERSGSLRRFWISRVFRLYPLYLASLLAVLALWGVGWMRLPPAFVQGFPSTALANFSMVQELLGFLYAECCTRNKAVQPEKILCCK